MKLVVPINTRRNINEKIKASLKTQMTVYIKKKRKKKSFYLVIISQ